MERVEIASAALNAPAVDTWLASVLQYLWIPDMRHGRQVHIAPDLSSRWRHALHSMVNGGTTR